MKVIQKSSILNRNKPLYKNQLIYLKSRNHAKKLSISAMKTDVSYIYNLFKLLVKILQFLFHYLLKNFFQTPKPINAPIVLRMKSSISKLPLLEIDWVISITSNMIMNVTGKLLILFNLFIK